MWNSLRSGARRGFLLDLSAILLGMGHEQGFELLPADGRADQVEQVLRTGFSLDVGAMLFDRPGAQSVQLAHFLVALSQQGLRKNFPLAVGEGWPAGQIQ